MEQSDARQLRYQLNRLVEEAHHNQAKLQRFQELELRLLGISGLATMIESLLDEAQQAFELEWVTLALWDPDHDFRRTLMQEHSPLLEGGRLQLFDAQLRLLTPFANNDQRPLLCPFNVERHAHLFPAAIAPDHPNSIALLPLVRQGQLIGSLNLGSRAADRYRKGQGTVFLEHFGAIVALCIENALNHQRLLHISLSDTLTGANNRRFFDQRLPEEVARALRHNQPLTLMFIDLDHFKRVNDEFGHQSGDQVLREAATIFREQLRHSDTLARYGGEEFVVLLPMTDNRPARQLAERIRHAIEQHTFTLSDGQRLSVTASIGMTTLPGDEYDQFAGDLAERLLGRADEAVYMAKEQGRNRVVNHPLVDAHPTASAASAG